MDLNAAVPAAIVGAVIATLGVFAVEMWLKPRLARRRVACILAIEIRLNIRLIDVALKHRQENPARVSESFVLSQRAWEAASDELQYLQESTLRPLLLVYNQFQEINSLVRGHSRKGDQLLRLTPGPPFAALLQEFQDNAQVFGDMLTGTRAQCERTLPHLTRIIERFPVNPVADKIDSGKAPRSDVR